MLIVLVLFWGFAEATLFFIVPDILLGWIILTRKKHILPSYGFAVAGALMGGAVMYLWGKSNLDSVNTILTQLPALDASMIENAREGLANNSFLEMLKGSLSGTPYKVYAANAASLGIGLGHFLMLSIPARFLRWLLIGLSVWGVQILLLNRLSIRVVKSVYLTCWLIFYVIFFAL